MKKIKHNSFVVKTAPKDPFHISEETELRSLEPRTRVYPDLPRTARNLLAGGDLRRGEVVAAERGRIDFSSLFLTLFAPFGIVGK